MILRVHRRIENEAVELAECAIQSERIPSAAANCNGCGNRAMDLLVWDDEAEFVTCALCDEEYLP